MIYNEQDHKYSAFKRVGIFLIDGLIILILYLGLLFTLGTSVITNISKDEVKVINKEFVRVCDQLDVAYLEHDLYDLNQIDQEKIIDEAVSNGLTSEEGFIKYNEVTRLVNDELIKSDLYKDNFNSFYKTYLITNILMMFLSLLLLELVIPLFNKKHQTIGMLLFNTCLVNKDNFVILSKYQVLLRFFVIFLLEYLVIYLFLNITGLILLILLSITSICFTNNRYSFSDLLLKVKMTKKEDSYDE